MNHFIDSFITKSIHKIGMDDNISKLVILRKIENMSLWPQDVTMAQTVNILRMELAGTVT